MNKITPFLWFDNQAEEAMNFYVSIFEDSELLSITPGPNGVAQSVTLNAFAFYPLVPPQPGKFVVSL